MEIDANEVIAQLEALVGRLQGELVQKQVALTKITAEKDALEATLATLDQT